MADKRQLYKIRGDFRSDRPAGCLWKVRRVTTCYSPYLYFTLTVCDAYSNAFWYEELDGRWGEVGALLRSRLYRLIYCGGNGWPEAFVIDGVMVHAHLLIDGQLSAALAGMHPRMLTRLMGGESWDPEDEHSMVRKMPMYSMLFNETWPTVEHYLARVSKKFLTNIALPKHHGSLDLWTSRCVVSLVRITSITTPFWGTIASRSCSYLVSPTKYYSLIQLLDGGVTRCC